MTVSYDEWAQQFKWDAERVQSELAKTMRLAYAALTQVANEKNVDLRTAAFVLAVGV